jgi:hypothetical protein
MVMRMSGLDLAIEEQMLFLVWVPSLENVGRGEEWITSRKSTHNVSQHRLDILRAARLTLLLETAASCSCHIHQKDTMDTRSMREVRQSHRRHRLSSWR